MEHCIVVNFEGKTIVLDEKLEYEFVSYVGLYILLQIT